MKLSVWFSFQMLFSLFSEADAFFGRLKYLMVLCLFFQSSSCFYFIHRFSEVPEAQHRPLSWHSVNTLSGLKIREEKKKGKHY